MVLAPGTLDAALSAAEKESLSHLQFLHRLLVVRQSSIDG